MTILLIDKYYIKEVAMMKTKPEEINNKTKGKLNKSKANTKDKVKVRSLGRKIVVTVSVFLMLAVAISTYFQLEVREPYTASWMPGSKLPTY